MPTPIPEVAFVCDSCGREHEEIEHRQYHGLFVDDGGVRRVVSICYACWDFDNDCVGYEVPALPG